MSDYANIELLYAACPDRDEDGHCDFCAALDALVAERDEAQEKSRIDMRQCDEMTEHAMAAENERDEAREHWSTWHDHFEEVNSQLKIKQVECDDVTARAVAAEAEVARLRQEAQEATEFIGRLCITAETAEADRDAWIKAAADNGAAQDAAEAERDEARRRCDRVRELEAALQTTRAAWNAHMEACPQPQGPTPDRLALLVAIEDIQRWLNAPSDTASAALAKEDA